MPTPPTASPRPDLLPLLLTLCLGAPSAHAQAPAPSPAAVVLAQPVTEAEIEPSPQEAARQKAGLDAGALARRQLQARAERLAALVQQRLLDAYARQHGLEATEAELRPLLASAEEESRDVDARMEQVRQQRIAKLRAQLAVAGLAPAERDRLQTELARWEGYRPGGAARDDGGRALVKTLVQNWKVQRALHRRFGGRVLVSSFGAHVAIDALLQYLREEEKRGSFRIPDPGLRAAFWTAVADTAWADSVAEGAAAGAVFETPPWKAKARQR